VPLPTSMVTTPPWDTGAVLRPARHSLPLPTPSFPLTHSTRRCFFALPKLCTGSDRRTSNPFVCPLSGDPDLITAGTPVLHQPLPQTDLFSDGFQHVGPMAPADGPRPTDGPWTLSCPRLGFSMLASWPPPMVPGPLMGAWILICPRLGFSLSAQWLPPMVPGPLMGS